MILDTYKPVIIIALLLAVGIAWPEPAVAGSTLFMSIENLKDRIGDPNIVILDVRTGSDWTAASRKIKGALRFEPEKFSTWAGLLPKNKTLVFY